MTDYHYAFDNRTPARHGTVLARSLTLPIKGYPAYKHDKDHSMLCQSFNHFVVRDKSVYVCKGGGVAHW